MKIELGSFYLGDFDTVFVFTRETEGDVSGTAFQNGVAYRIDLRKENLKGFKLIPITPAIAKIVQSGQAIDTGLV